MEDVILKNGPRDGDRIKVQQSLLEDRENIEVGSTKYKPPTKTTTTTYEHHEVAEEGSKHYVPKNKS